jgi:hypothetical protein
MPLCWQQRERLEAVALAMVAAPERSDRRKQDGVCHLRAYLADRPREDCAQSRRAGGSELPPLLMQKEKQSEQRSARQQDLEQQIRARLLQEIAEDSEAPKERRTHLTAPFL